MKLDWDIMVRVHQGEVTPAEAFAAQGARSSNAPAPAPLVIQSRPEPLPWAAVALVPRVVIDQPLGAALVAACAVRGIRLTLRECYEGYRAALASEANAITWGMKLPHSDYTAGGRNVLFAENGLLCQRHGVYLDAAGYFGDSSLVTAEDWRAVPTAGERDALAAHLAREFGWEPGATYDPAGPIMLALQTPHDAPIQHYLTRHEWDGLRYVVDCAAAYLPRGVPVVLRPHPRHDFQPGDYRIPDAWTIEREGNPYDRLRQCRALVCANSTLGIEALGLGMPVACLGRHVYSGSAAVLECDGHPERLTALPDWRPDPERITGLLCAIMRRQMPYRATAAAVEASPQFHAWADRCRTAHATPPVDALYAAASMRLRASADPVGADLADATDTAVTACTPCARARHYGRIIEVDSAMHGGRAPLFGPRVIRDLALTGLEVVRADLTGYTGRLAAAQAACSERLPVPVGTITLGFVYNAHLGDTLCSTVLPGPLQASGRTVRVVRHRTTYAAFAGHGLEFANPDRLRLNPPASVGPGHVIQRLQRWFGLPEDTYPRPMIRLAPEEQAWASAYCATLPRPIILVSTGAVSNGQGYAAMPWPQWGAALNNHATVLQCLAGPAEPLIPGATVARGLTVRQWFALFGQAAGYLGTWAAGIHCAAAFGLEAVVVCHAPIDPTSLVFPQPPAHIRVFLYPQHAYGIHRP